MGNIVLVKLKVAAATFIDISKRVAAAGQSDRVSKSEPAISLHEVAIVPEDMTELYEALEGKKEEPVSPLVTADYGALELRVALQPLVAIADAYDNNELDDEARKFWGRNSEHVNTTPPDKIELFTGRGGKCLLTLQDCLTARAVIRGSSAKPVDAIVTFLGVNVEHIKQVRLIKAFGRYPVGHVFTVVKFVPHGGNYDCEGQVLADDGTYIPIDKVEVYNGAL